MATLDWVVIAAYFAGLLGLAWWVILKGKDTAEDYFLSGRSLSWFVIGASIFASNIGSEHLVGLAGSGATSGVALAHYELHAWCLLVLGWVMVPFYLRSKVFTMPEFLERRFSPASRTVLSVISLVAYVLTKLAVGIFAGGVVFGVLLPELSLTAFGVTFNSFWVGSVLVVVLTGLYTVLGGMRAVAYTEALQTLVLVLGSVLLTLFGLKALGGWSELRAVLDPDLFNLWKPLVPAGVSGTWAPVLEPTRMAWYFNSNFPWLGMLLCAPIIGLWYWTTDQYIVQRALGARDERHARRGSIFAAFLKLLPVFIFIIPGMIALALAKTGRAPGLTSMVDAQGNVIANAARLADAARRAGMPVIHIHYVVPPGAAGLKQNAPLFRAVKEQGGNVRGTWGAAPADGVEPKEGDFIVEKTRMNGFYDTNLDILLRGLGADTIVITGAWTNMSIEHTARHGADAGYEIVVVSDGTSTINEDWQRVALEYALTNVGEAATVDEVIAALR